MTKAGEIATCPRGHEYVRVQVYRANGLRNGFRCCPRCESIRFAEYYNRNRELVRAQQAAYWRRKRMNEQT